MSNPDGTAADLKTRGPEGTGGSAQGTLSPLLPLPLPPPQTSRQQRVVKFKLFKLSYLKSITIDRATQVRYLITMAQKSSTWITSRGCRITGSQVGAILNHNTYESASSVLQGKIWPTSFSNAYTEYGQMYEDVAVYKFMEFMSTKGLPEVSSKSNTSKPSATSAAGATGGPITGDNKLPPVSVPGIKFAKVQFVCPFKMPWTAFSPDGILLINGILGLLEIKCPGKLKLTRHIMHAYYDQIQWSMGIAGLEYTYFVMYTPWYTCIRKVLFNREYFYFMVMKAYQFFTKDLLVAQFYKDLGLLKQGQTQPSVILM